MEKSRRRSVVLVLGIALVLALSACMTSSQMTVASELNSDRKSNGRGSLPSHSTLNVKAQNWAEKLARDGRLSHSTLSSGAPSCWQSLGENVGYGPSIAAVEDAYMRSSGHRANILNTKWDYIGVGYAKKGSRVYTVQVFMMGC